MGEPQSRSGRRGEEKILDLTGARTRSLGRLVRSQSLYRLRYPASQTEAVERNKICVCPLYFSVGLSLFEITV
jgi:hypothetical protein